MRNLNTKTIGAMIKNIRKSRHITQSQLALVAGVGLRFISDLERGKPSCEIEKVLRVLSSLNIEIILQEHQVDNDG